MPTKLTQEAFIKKSLIKHNSKYTYSSTAYRDLSSKITITCPVHGDFVQRARQHLLGSGCLKCSKELLGKVMGLGYSEFVGRSKVIHNNAYSYDKATYTNNYTKITITCPVHGDFKQQPSLHLQGSGCPKCSLQRKCISFSEFEARGRLAHNSYYSYNESAYTTVDADTTITCPVHGDFVQRAISHTNLKQGCPKCSADSKRLSSTDISTRFNEVHGSLYDYSKSVYISYKDPVEIVCKTHGSFLSTPSNHILGTGCPRCSTVVSKAHSKLIDTLAPLNRECLVNTRDIIAPFELDIYFTDSRVAVEVNGVYRHSSSSYSGKIKSKHKNKLTLCSARDIHLLQFTDLEVSNKLPIVSSVISSSLGVFTSTIYARKCTIKVPTKQEVRFFLEDNHIQGAVGSSIEVGLYYKEELVQVITFGKSRLNKKYDYELIRLCSKLRSKIVGGSSKLFSFFVKNYLRGGEKIISYCDLRLFKGAVYDRLGFRWLRDSSPNYFYTKGSCLESRLSYQKHKLSKLLANFDPLKTEMENMFNHGYRIYYDCGNGVWEFTNEHTAVSLKETLDNSRTNDEACP